MMPKRIGSQSQITTLFHVALQKLRQDGLASFLQSSIDALRRPYNSKEAQSEFDRLYGTDTGGIVPLWKLQIRSPNHKDGVRYQASDPDFVRKAIEILPIRLERFQYIDVGSGKGLTLLVASEYPFLRVLGIEFSAELNGIARENIRKLQKRKCQEVSSIVADAASYDFSTENAVIFLYNPFGKKVLQRMLENLRMSLMKNDREIYIVYSNPIFAHLLADCDFLDRLDLPIAAAIYRHSPAYPILQHGPRPHVHVVDEN